MISCLVLTAGSFTGCDHAAPLRDDFVGRSA
jgi:hypothetical protein